MRVVVSTSMIIYMVVVILGLAMVFRSTCVAGKVWSFNGGSVEVERTEIILEHEEDINFPLGTKLGNDLIWLRYSLGKHMVSEREKTLWSLNNGKSWGEPPIHISGVQVCKLPMGAIIGVSKFTSEYQRIHSLDLWTWFDLSEQPVPRKVGLELPWDANLLLHRSLIRLQSGRLVVSGWVHVTISDMMIR